MGSFSVDRDRTVPVTEGPTGVSETVGSVDDRRHSLARFSKDREVAHANSARRGEMAAMSSGMGETPQKSRQRSLHDPKWESTSSAVEKVGVHEARSSMWLDSGSAASCPKGRLTTEVTVPASAWYGVVRLQRIRKP